MESLSVVIITYNEEKNIGKCIDSVQGLADEILVMDSYSADKTAVIAKEKGALLYQHKFEGYGDQKNRAAELCSSSFVLFLDADEYPGPGLYARILEEKKAGFPYDAYSMNRLNRYCGQWIRHGSWYPDKKLRLVRKGRGSWNNELVHESLVAVPGIQPKHLGEDLLHEAYGSIEEHISKNNRYSSLSAKLLFDKGKRTSLLKILVNPWWAFCSGYILRLGMLDGFNGLVIAVNVAHLTFLKHVKLYRLQQSKSPSEGKNSRDL